MDSLFMGAQCGTSVIPDGANDLLCTDEYVHITLTLPTDVAAHILDVLAEAFPSIEPRTPAELVKLALDSFVLGEWLKMQGDSVE